MKLDNEELLAICETDDCELTADEIEACKLLPPIAPLTDAEQESLFGPEKETEKE